VLAGLVTKTISPGALTNEVVAFDSFATCDTSLRGRRDRALLLFAWTSGGRLAPKWRLRT